MNLPRTKTLVLYCPCQHEEESTEMASKLEKLGYSKLKLLQGGLPRWRELKYPTAGKTGRSGGAKPADLRLGKGISMRRALLVLFVVLSLMTFGPPCLAGNRRRFPVLLWEK